MGRQLRARFFYAAAGGLLTLGMSGRAFAIVSSTGNGINGTDVATAIGANALYAMGYTGSRAVVANIEAGYVWTGQESTSGLASSILDFHAPTNNATTTPWLDRHATWVGQTIAGSGPNAYQRGIAYGATLWSGAIATSWDSGGTTYSGSFEFATNDAFFSPYYQATVGGVSVVNDAAGNAVTSRNYGTADIVTSSWGNDTSDQRELGGNSDLALSVDAMASASGKLVVFAAGNDGSPDTIGSPANGCNTLTVGALTGDAGTPAYNSVAGFSSRGPQNMFIPTTPDGTAGRVVPVVRARVDISAPGDNLTLAYYGGPTGGNFAGTADASTAAYTTDLWGTSFATPVVAAGAALIVDAGKDKFAADPRTIDGRVLKALLMNSADKTAGWTNQTKLVNGVLRTTQGLDFGAGAGRIDVGAAYAQYTSGTTDIAGTASGAAAPIGWDYAEVAATAGSHEDYPFAAALAGGSTFTATVSWYENAGLDLADESGTYGSFFNLDLQLYAAVDGIPTTLVAESASLYNSSEQIYITLPESGSYVLRILDVGALWNFNGDTSVPYGLAWSGTASVFIPEPGSLAWVAMAGLVLRRRR